MMCLSVAVYQSHYTEFLQASFIWYLINLGNIPSGHQLYYLLLCVNIKGGKAKSQLETFFTSSIKFVDLCNGLYMPILNLTTKT